MKSIFKKYRIFFAAAFLLALFFCCRTLFPAFQLQHKGSESFNNFISRLFADELTSNTMNLHFTLKDPSSMGIDSYEVTFGDFPPNHKKAVQKIWSICKKNCPIIPIVLWMHKTNLHIKFLRIHSDVSGHLQSIRCMKKLSLRQTV